MNNLFSFSVLILFLYTSSVFSAPLSITQYKEVKNGMTYEQVVNILGKPTQELSRSDMMGYVTVMYMWEGESMGANMNAMFQNNKLINKAQFGLR